MLKLIKTDIYRILHTKTLYITIAGLIAFTSLVVFSETLIISGIVDPTMQQTLEHTPTWGMTEAIMACTMGLSVFAWFCIPFYAMIVGSEFSYGTYKNIFLSGISRFQFVLIKLILIFICIIGMLCIFFGFGALFGYINGGVGTLAFDSSIINNLLLTGLFCAIITTLYYSIAMSLQVSTNSLALAIVSLVALPLVIQFAQMAFESDALNAVSFSITTFKATIGQMSFKDIIQTLIANVGVLSVSTFFSSYVLTKKEF